MTVKRALIFSLSINQQFVQQTAGTATNKEVLNILKLPRSLVKGLGPTEATLLLLKYADSVCLVVFTCDLVCSIASPVD